MKNHSGWYVFKRSQNNVSKKLSPMNHTSSHHDNEKAVSQFSAPQVLLVSSKNHEVLAKSKALPPWLILQP